MAAVCHLPAQAQESASEGITMDSFGATRVNPRQRQTLTLSFGADAAIDRDRSAAGAGSPFGGPHAHLRSGLMYRRQHGSSVVSLSAASGLQHYPGREQVSAPTHSLNGGFSTTLGRHTQLQVHQRVMRSPFFTVSFPAAGSGEDLAALTADYDTFRWTNTALATNVGVTQAVGRRASIAVTYGSHSTRMAGSRFASQAVGAGYNHQIGRYATARVGYSRLIATRESGDAARDARARHRHDVDLGIDYNRPLSLSRRTKLAFRSGSSVVPSNGRTHVQVSGAASLSREIGRTWSTVLEYGRHVQFLETLEEPLLADTVSLSVRGTLLRRLNLSASTSLSVGQVGSGSGDREYETQLAGVRARWTFHRFLALYANSSYYRHKFGAAAAIAPGVQLNADRREVRFGLMTWVPLLH